MKKIINIFIILFLLIYVEALNVNASVNKCQNSVLITEDSQATDTGWAANMVVCADYRFTNTYRTVGNGYDSINYSVFSDVKKIGRILVEAYQRSIDNKEVVSVQVPLCNDSRAGIGVVVTCHYYKYVKEADVVPAKTEAQCNPRPRSQCNSGCMWDASVTLERESAKPQNGINIQPMFDATGGKCVVDESVTKYDCGSYHVNKTNGKCYSWTEYVYDKPDPIKLDETENRSGYLSEASEACRNNYGSTDYACQCLDKDIKYAFKCPLYECTKGTLSVRTCTPTFSKQGENNKKVNVYCVNPSLPFEKIYNETAEYIPDDEFNVNDCSSSYSTVDCGYANILIEGQYNNWNYKTIELALRLWGAYTNQKGYNGVGISNRRTKYSDNKCGKSVTFLLDDDDEVINPYKRTVAEAYKMYFETISNKDYYDPKKEYSKVSLNCSITQGGRTVYLHGVACSGDNYKKAVALFFNTVSGNPKMREHLSSLFGNEISTEVTNALLRVDEHDKPYIEIKLPEFDKVTQPKNVKLECDKLDDLVREGKLTEEQKEQILPYCQIHIQLVDENGRVIKDNGRPYGDAEPDYCEKDYCVLYVHEFAICEYVESTHHVPYIKVTYPKSRSSNSILKLWSCEDPDDTQTMFAFASDLIQEPGKPEKVTQKFKISKYTCTNDCEEVPQDKINNKCEDNNGEYGNVYKSGIKDLSLKCILNLKSQATKRNYDYSDYYGVNTNLCRVYCSDEFQVSMPDKVLVKRNTARAFYYDVEFLTNGNVTRNQKLTAIVKEKRTCVSEIYYNNEFQDEIDWQRIYGLTDEETATVKNWKTLFSVMLDKAAKENGRTEILNQLLYDLYNCNFYSKAKFETAGIIKPRNYDYDMTIEKLNDYFSENKGYGLSNTKNCTVNNSNGTNTCVNMNNVAYTYGGSPDGQSVNMKAVTSSKNNFDKLVYCRGRNCFKYVYGSNDNYTYPEYVEVKPGQTDPSFTNYSLRASDGTIVKFNGRNSVVVPTNDYAMFEVETEIGYYNAEEYDILPTGEVYHKGSHLIDPLDKYVTYGKYAYSVAPEANTDSHCSTRDFLNETVRCDIDISFSTINTFYRHNGNDSFGQSLKTNKKFSCFVDVESPTPPPPDPGTPGSNGTRYRMVDTANMFPITNGTPEPMTNWATDIGLAAIERIVQSTNDLPTEEYLQYRITISPAQIKKIREYNQVNKGQYSREATFNCNIVDGAYRNCKSVFLNELRASTKYGTIDRNFSNGISPHDR